MTRPTRGHRPLAPGSDLVLSAAILGTARRLQPLRQPRRRALLHRLCAQDRPVRTGGGTRASPRPVTPACAKPSTWQPIMPGTSTRPWRSATTDSSSSKASTTTQRYARSGRPHHPDRCLLAQRRALRAARRRRRSDHRGRRQGGLQQTASRSTPRSGAAHRRNT